MEKQAEKIIYTATVFGDKGVGKSNFISSITSNDLERQVTLRDKLLDNNITFQFYEEDYEKLTTSICVILIYDITNETTFQYVKQKFLTAIKDNFPREKSFVILLGNKTDLETQRVMNANQAEQFASQHGMFFLETSTRGNKNIELVQKVMRIRSSHLIKKNSISGQQSLIVTSSIITTPTPITTTGYTFPSVILTNDKLNTSLQKNDVSIGLNSSIKANQQQQQDIMNYPKQINQQQQYMEKRDLHGIDLSNALIKSPNHKRSPKKMNEQGKKYSPRSILERRFSSKENSFSSENLLNKDSSFGRDLSILKDLSNSKEVSGESSFNQSPKKISYIKDNDSTKGNSTNEIANFSRNDSKAKVSILGHIEEENYFDCNNNNIENDNNNNNQETKKNTYPTSDISGGNGANDIGSLGINTPNSNIFCIPNEDYDPNLVYNEKHTILYTNMMSKPYYADNINPNEEKLPDLPYRNEENNINLSGILTSEKLEESSVCMFSASNILESNEPFCSKKSLKSMERLSMPTTALATTTIPSELKADVIKSIKKELPLATPQFRSNGSHESSSNNHSLIIENKFQEQQNFDGKIPSHLFGNINNKGINMQLNSKNIMSNLNSKEIDLSNSQNQDTKQNSFIQSGVNSRRTNDQYEDSQDLSFREGNKKVNNQHVVYAKDEISFAKLNYETGSFNIRSRQSVETGGFKGYSKVDDSSSYGNQDIVYRNDVGSLTNIPYPSFNENMNNYGYGYNGKSIKNLHPYMQQNNENFDDFEFMNNDELHDQREKSSNKNNIYESESDKSEELGDIDNDIKQLEESLVSLDKNFIKKESLISTTPAKNESIASQKQTDQANSSSLINLSVRSSYSNSKNPNNQSKTNNINRSKAAASLHDDSTNHNDSRNSKNIIIETSLNQIQGKSNSKKSKQTNNGNSMTPKSLEKKSTKTYQCPIQNAHNPFNPCKKPILFIHIESTEGEIDVVPIYQDDTSFNVAERYYCSKGITRRDNLKVVANLIEEKINNVSLEFDDFLFKYESQLLKEKNDHYNLQREKLLKESKPFSLSTEKRSTQRISDDGLIGKLYIELESKKIVALNIKEMDDSFEVASKFVATYSLKKIFFKLILNAIQEIKDYYETNKNQKNYTYPIRNLIIKDYKFTNNSSASLTNKDISEYSMNDNLTPLKSIDISSQSNTMTKSPREINANAKTIFKLNFDIGNGRVSKIAVKEGDSLSKVAHHFAITYKLGNNAYEKILDVLEKTYKIKMSNNIKELKKMENAIYLQD